MSFIRRNRRSRRAITSVSKAQITASMREYEPMLVDLAKTPLTLSASVVRDETGRPTGEFDWQDTIEVSLADADNANALRGYGKTLKSMAKHLGIVVATSEGYETDTGSRAMDVSVRRMYTPEELAMATRPKVSELLAKMPSPKDALDAALTEHLALDVGKLNASDFNDEAVLGLVPNGEGDIEEAHEVAILRDEAAGEMGDVDSDQDEGDQDGES